MSNRTQLTLSPMVHEKYIERHMRGGEVDPILEKLHAGVKLAREVAIRSRDLTEKVLADELKTPAQRHREARTASFALFEKATLILDQACQAADAELTAIERKLSGPLMPKDQISAMRARERRERLLALPEPRRREVIAQADEDVVAAILSVAPWEVNMTDAEHRMVRHTWTQKHFPAELERVAQLQKATADAKRCASLSMAYLDKLTDAELVSRAEAAEKAAKAALKEAS